MSSCITSSIDDFARAGNRSQAGRVMSGRSRHKLQDVNREAAIHIRHFLHAYRGTSAMIVLYDENDVIPIFVKIYSSQPYSSSKFQAFNSQHAEKFLLTDKSMLDRIVRENEGRHQALTLRIFQSNSPCLPCSQLFMDFHSELESRLREFNLEPPVIEVQVGWVWKLRFNAPGLKKMFGAVGARQSPYTLNAIDWIQFYDAFYKWMGLQNQQDRQSSPVQDMFPISVSPDNIITHLYRISASRAVELTCEGMATVKGKIDALSMKWNSDVDDQRQRKRRRQQRRRQRRRQRQQQQQQQQQVDYDVIG